MIDTRFPPIIKKVHVALYRQRTAWPKFFTYKAKSSLVDYLSNILDCSSENIILTESASAGLYGYLMALRIKDIKVALPAFSCQSLVEAIIQAGCEPIFIDIGSNTEISITDAQYAVKQSCNFFIWPNYFADRPRSEKVINFLKDNKVRIIIDEAQSFSTATNTARLIKYDNDELLLLSFGLSKSIAGSGGGAICMAQPDYAFRYMRIKTLNSKDPKTRYALLIISMLKERLFLVAPKLSMSLRIKPKRYDRLDTLLNSKPFPTFKNLGINPYDAQTAFVNLLRSSDCSEKTLAAWRRLREAIIYRWGEGALFYINESQIAPNIVAIRINPDERFKLLLNLASRGIQATWYYFPLPLVTKYSAYKTAPLKQTIGISSSILILPFQWRHTQRQHSLLIRAITSESI